MAATKRPTVLSTEGCMKPASCDPLVEEFAEAGFPAPELIVKCGMPNCRRAELFYINAENSNVNVEILGSVCLRLDRQQE